MVLPDTPLVPLVSVPEMVTVVPLSAGLLKQDTVSDVAVAVHTS
jgi:hypothetical protein